jgi:hypothetical protein
MNKQEIATRADLRNGTRARQYNAGNLKSAKTNQTRSLHDLYDACY